MVKIISDSTSDLSQDLLDRYNITPVPLIVRLGDQQYEDHLGGNFPLVGQHKESADDCLCERLDDSRSFPEVSGDV